MQTIKKLSLKVNIKYLLIFLIISSLSFIIIVTNIRYLDLNETKLELSRELNTKQEIINHRNYVLTALYTTERILEGTFESTLFSVLSKINTHLPTTLLNNDFKLSTETLWRYESLQGLVLSYVSKYNNINDDSYYTESMKQELKQNVLLQVTALKLELEPVLKHNLTNFRNLTLKLKHLNNQLEQLFVTAITFLILLGLSFYYYLYTIKQDNKFKLLHLAKINSKKELSKISEQKDFIIAIEHNSQRAHFSNSKILKQISQQKDILKIIMHEHSEVINLINKLDAVYNKQSISNKSGNFKSSNYSSDYNSKAAFRIYASIVDKNKDIDNNLNTLRQGNEFLIEQLAKSSEAIHNIFKTSQKLSLFALNLKKTKSQFNADFKSQDETKNVT